MFDDNMTTFVRNLDSIVTRVEDANGVLTMTMKELKDLYGAGRLGVQVRDRIAEGLNYKRLYFLGDLPNDERAEVRLYIKGSKVGRILEAAGTLGATADQQLRDFAYGNETSELNNFAHDLREVLTRYTRLDSDSQG